LSVTDFGSWLVGDAPYARQYVARVRDTRDRRVILPGAIYGQGYHELLSHCFAYIHATEVGGTHPALVGTITPTKPFSVMYWAACDTTWHVRVP
jgi:hypothetical protein